MLEILLKSVLAAWPDLARWLIQQCLNWISPYKPGFRLGLQLRLNETIEPNVSLWAVTFKKREPASSVSRWMDDRVFELTADLTGTFNLRFLEIEPRLRKPNFPFKTYISVPVDRRHDYCALLVDAGAIVTGRGEEDINNRGNWRIWFLFPNASLHPDIEDVYCLNMKVDGT